MFDTEPIVPPDDRADVGDESGPWRAILLVTALAWVALAVVEWRLLTRSLAVEGVDVGPVKWLYAGVALVFPPIGGLYLGHRRFLVAG